MRYAVFLPALAGLALAIPRAEPQSIPLDIVDAAPDPVLEAAPIDVDDDVVDGVSRRGLEMRDGNCALLPTGAGSVPTPDTVDAFMAYPDYATMSTSAPTPYGYNNVFTNLQATLFASNYMGLHTISSYDVYACSDYCDAASGCMAFNLYIERDPSVSPNAASCPNPPSTINYKCTLWGAPITAAQAKNNGQYRDSFHVVITGSNGYVKNAPPPSIPGYGDPTELGGAINAPLDSNKHDSYLGYNFFSFDSTQTFDPTLCANECTNQNNYDLSHPAVDCSYRPCVFFNVYVLSKNGIPLGMACSKYDETWARKYGNNVGQYNGADHYTVTDSYSYSLQNAPTAPFIAPECTPN